jgi:hypothetical protein
LLEANTLQRLDEMRQKLLTLDINDIGAALKIATSIHGLGVAGGSGLLALMYPQHFGVVDQFVVKALLKVGDLAEHSRLVQMNPSGLTIGDGVVLIDILRRKAAELGHDWTPRKVDAVLWIVGR